MSRPLRDQARIRSPATAMQARRPSHLTSATNSPASGGSAATAVAEHRSDETKAVPGHLPRHRRPPHVSRPRACPGHASTVTGVLTWKDLP